MYDMEDTEASEKINVCKEKKENYFWPIEMKENLQDHQM